MHVGFVVLGGGGYMGEIGIRAIQQLKDERSEDIVEFVGVVEVNQEKYPAVAKILDDLRFPSAQVWPSIKHSVSRAREYHESISLKDRPKPRLIVYDATPTSFHAGNLRYVTSLPFSRSVVYLGEKPIFLDIQDINAFRKRGDCFFCDFVEIANPVFRATSNYIQAHELTIKEMWFWRAGDIGILGVCGEGRQGVTGGSLFDKSVHDLSISMGMLSPGLIEDVELQRAEVECLQLNTLVPRPTFMSVGGPRFPPFLSHHPIKLAFSPDRKGTTEDRSQLPADAMFSMDVKWKFRDNRRPVMAHYLSSWIGYAGDSSSPERNFVGKLQELGITEDEWRDEHLGREIDDRGKSGGLKRRFVVHEQEARLAIVECATPEGEQVYLVCNFLGGKFVEGRTRWAVAIQTRSGAQPDRHKIYPISSADREEEVKPYTRRKIDDLGAIFDKVISYCATGWDDWAISQRSSLWVHQVLIDAQREALNAIDFPKLKEHSKTVFANKLRILSARGLRSI